MRASVIILMAGLLVGLAGNLFAQGRVTTEAIDWLEANQDVSGLWGVTEKTPYRDATLVVEVLARMAADPSVLDAALDTIGRTTTSSTDYLARKIIAMASVVGVEVPPELIDSLISRRSGDGGWGYSPGYATNVLETALALKALHYALDSTVVEMGTAVNRLKALQNPDGGWSFVYGDSSRVFFTAHALISLILLSDTYSSTTQISNGIAWLESQVHPDGGFGTGATSNPYESGLALAALALNDSTSVAAINARAYLESTQLPNGSWNNNAYETAAALYGIINHQAIYSLASEMSRGLNLVGLPLEPLEPIQSNDLAGQIPFCTDVFGWDRAGQQWMSGTFEVNIQNAYFVETSDDADWIASGRSMPDGLCTSLEPGLNFVSVPNMNACYSAFSLLDSITGCTELHSWNATVQQWESVFRSSGDSLLGIDFPVAAGVGYCVRATGATEWCSIECDTIVEPELPDLLLAVSDIMITTNPVGVGEVTSIYARLHNIGDDTAFSPVIHFFEGDPDAGGTYIMQYPGIPDLPPGSTSPGWYGFANAWFSAGSIDIYAVADYDNLIAENNEDNNKAFQTLVITAKAAAPGFSGKGSSRIATALPGEDSNPWPSSTPQPTTVDAVAVSQADRVSGRGQVADVIIGSLTSSAASITWTTDDFSFGVINYGAGGPVMENSTFESTGGGYFHLAQLTGLEVGTDYYFEINTGDTVYDNDGAYYTFITPLPQAGRPATVYGRVEDTTGAAATGIIVGAILKHNDLESHPLVTLSDDAGGWVFNLGNLRDQITGDTVSYQLGDSLLIWCEAGINGMADTGLVIDGSPQDAGLITLYVPIGCCENRGNVDGLSGPAGPIDVADVTYLVATLWLGGPNAPCIEEGNVDGLIGPAGPIDVADVTYLVAKLWMGGPEPPPCP